MFTLPELPYGSNALEPFIDEETMHIHHDKHHAAYIKNLNDALAYYSEYEDLSVEDILKNLDTVIAAPIKTKVKNNAGGHYNHSLFWQMLRPPGGTPPSGKLLEAINRDFESLESFQTDFTAVALGLFGSGWVWLVKDGEMLKITTTPNQDSPISNNQHILLGLDVWEHAYYLKYKNMRADYIKNWWSVVNWDFVNAQLLLESSQKAL